VAQMMAVILVQRMGVPLKRNLRFAGIADGFGPGPGGLEYLAEHHLTLMEAERCLSFGYPPSAELPGKIVFFLHCAERGVLRLTLRSEGKCGALGETGAVQNLLGGIRALADEFAGDFAGDRETRRVFDGLRAASTDKSVADALMQIDRDPALKADPNRQNDRGIPEALIGYLRSLKRTPLTVTFIHAGSSGGVGARCAEAEVAIMPCPGMSLSQCGAKAVAALEKLGPDAPYIAKASQSAGSASRHDDELHRVLQAACRSVSPGAELVEAVSPVNLGLSVLRQLGIEVWGFNPLELPLGLDDGARRAFSNDERIAKSSLGRMVRVMFEALVRLAS
jgi:acetylornithine deacetylase/succinyl-diaminopimelate desuccinylase-like protein